MGHHENEPTYLAIGRFIFEFSQLEYTLRYQIAEAIGLADRFLDSVITHDFALLCTAAKQVLSEKLDEAAKRQLKRILNDCLSLNQERVRVAHGLWVPFREGGVVHHVPRTTLSDTRHVNQADHLWKQADKVQVLRNELDQLIANAVLDHVHRQDQSGSQVS